MLGSLKLLVELWWKLRKGRNEPDYLARARKLRELCAEGILRSRNHYLRETFRTHATALDSLIAEAEQVRRELGEAKERVAARRESLLVGSEGEQVDSRVISISKLNKGAKV